MSEKDRELTDLQQMTQLNQSLIVKKMLNSEYLFYDNFGIASLRIGDVKLILIEAKKDIFEGTDITKTHFKHSPPSWDYSDEDVEKVLTKFVKWIGDSK